MKEFASNILLALESGDAAIREGAIRTLEEVVPLIENKDLLSELKKLLQEFVQREKNRDAKVGLEKMVELVESYT